LGEHQFSNINRYVLQIILSSNVLTFPVRSKNHLRTSLRPRTFALRTKWPRRYVLSLPVL
jgi:hypothetical protein